VQQHGGHIQVYSEVGQGTTFKAYFPRVDVAVDLDDLANALITAAGGDETILLVEDEMAVREITQRTLEAHGYTVIVAASPAEADTLFPRAGGEISLLLTDVIMPGRNGVELYRQLVAAQPSLRVLFMSGYSDLLLRASIDQQQYSAFLQKPFNQTELLQKVRAVLDMQPQMEETHAAGTLDVN